jgi:two-component system, NtrC family, response regulator
VYSVVKKMEKLLIVDDSPEIRNQLKWGLGREYQVLQAGSAEEAFGLFEQHRPKAVTLDLGLPPDPDGFEEGLRILSGILQRGPDTKIIVLTGNEERNVALEAIQRGAYDFYQKPVDLAELMVILRRAYQLAALEEENRNLRAGCGNRTAMFGLFGQCDAMQQVFNTIRKVASSDVPILILGESGTGKELVAAAIHGEGLRKAGPFIPLNCGAIPETLLEAELFGHEKGAFTGAQGRVKGKVEYAHGGTLFLDEIGELPLILQVKLLRFLQNKMIQRLGGREDIPVDARIIAATNIDIAEAMAAGKFREDLYYRIGVITISLPPLRERGSDIALLANLFLHRFAEGLRKKVKGFSGAALDALQAYEWPGNVRELENRVKRAAIMAEAPILEPQHLGLATPANTAEEVLLKGMSLREGRDQVERSMVIAAMEQQEGNIVKMAEMLGVSRPAVYALMKKHGLHF